MKKVFKVSILSLALLFGFLLSFKANATECGTCKFGSGACTVDLRPGEGDGTLCNCSNGGKCEKGDGDACKCTKIVEATNTEQTTTQENIEESQTAPSVTSENNIVPTGEVNTELTTGATATGSSAVNNTVSIVLIIIGVIVVGVGIFAITKVTGSKKKNQ